MLASRLAPRRHVLVCVHRRAPGSALGPGCGDAGERVYAALKSAVSRQGEIASTWITATRCLGVCPPRGCGAVVHPGARVFAEVDAVDVDALLSAGVEESTKGR